MTSKELWRVDSGPSEGAVDGAAQQAVRRVRHCAPQPRVRTPPAPRAHSPRDSGTLFARGSLAPEAQEAAETPTGHPRTGAAAGAHKNTEADRLAAQAEAVPKAFLSVLALRAQDPLQAFRHVRPTSPCASTRSVSSRSGDPQ